MAEKRIKRPRDPVQLAKPVGEHCDWTNRGARSFSALEGV
jgi:hypothetical protein